MPEPGQYKCGFCDQATEYAADWDKAKPPCDECALAILLEKYPEFIHAIKEHSMALSRFIALAPRGR